jgi:hypothetical protein
MGSSSEDSNPMERINQYLTNFDYGPREEETVREGVKVWLKKYARQIRESTDRS